MSSNINADEKKVFLEEADEHLEALEKNLILLEKSKDDKGTLNNLFRAAHTLKGSSATYGCRKMSRLTHQLESVFDCLRNDRLCLDNEAFNILLSTVDVLKIIRTELEHDRDSGIDIEEGAAYLEMLMKENKRGESVSKTASAPAAFFFTADERNFIQEEKIKGRSAFNAKISLYPKTEMPSVRLVIIMEELRRAGTVMKTSPVIEELNTGLDYFQLALFMTTDESKDAIAGLVSGFHEIEKLEISEFSGDIPAQEARAADESGSGSSLDWKTKRITKKNASDTLEQFKAKKNIRVDVERMEALMNITSELVIEKNKLIQLANLISTKYENDHEVRKLIELKEQIDKKISGLQDEIMKARMVPLETVFSKFPRMIRDLAQNSGKEIAFHVSGSGVELDKTVIEEITDPLIHLLRNAVDHGIKSKGNIVLNARHSEGSVYIEVSDDGQGLNLEKIKKTALEKGIVGAQAVAAFSSDEIINLIFLPGFSTADKVSETSGRGVGMDIVKTNIEKIHGTVIVETSPGKGTKFIMKIPLTLAIIKALLVNVCGRKFAMPLHSVFEIMKVHQKEIQHVKHRATVLSRNAVLPLLQLREALNMESGGGNKRDTESFTVVVVTYLDRKVGFVIDDIMGESEIVVYSLGKYIGNVKGLSGATIDADGRVALILDVPSLVRSVVDQ
ncbi:MAG: chemotaxis protein CheA [Planctomycetes bacterium]|nr:chemotaxis protein CheA [Planctomycetota bacterium]